MNRYKILKNPDRELITSEEAYRMWYRELSPGVEKTKETEKIISKILQTDEGCQKLAASMFVPPRCGGWDYSGTVRIK